MALATDPSPSDALAEVGRSRLPHSPPTEEEHLALCLLMLANAGDRRRLSPPPAHKCTLCSKAFPTPQSLGGHKASHRRPPEAPRECAEGRLHRCNVCARAFSTGQALGGHKRCHYGGGASVAVPASRPPELDLNVPAVAADDGDSLAAKRPRMGFDG